MGLYYIWTVCYHLLQAFLIWLGWSFLKFIVGVSETFSFVGKCIVLYRFLVGHIIVAVLFFLFLFGLELLLYWLDDFVCKRIFSSEYEDSDV